MATNNDQSDEALQTQQAPGALAEYDYGDDEGAGWSNTSKDDYAIPFLVLLQALSPQCKRPTDPLVRPGNFYNTITERAYDGAEGVLIVPATTRHAFAMFVPRDDGGGYRGELSPDDPIVAAAIKASTEYGKYTIADPSDAKKVLQLVETFYVYCMLVDEARPLGYALLAFTSTKIAAYKRWMTRMRGVEIPKPGGGVIQPPLWAHLTRVKSEDEKNKKGEFSVIALSPGDPRGMVQSLLKPKDPRFIAARELAELVNSGKAKVDFSQQDGGGQGEGASPF